MVLVKFFGVVSLLRKLTFYNSNLCALLSASSNDTVRKLKPAKLVISVFISSLPSSFRGLGFSFRAVRFTSCFEKHNVFQIKHLGAFSQLNLSQLTRRSIGLQTSGSFGSNWSMCLWWLF